MTTEIPVVMILPQVKAALEAEAERSSVAAGLMGGLLFGYPLDGHRRLVVDWVRPRPEVRFGEKDFNLDQSRTSQQLDRARKLASAAHYCGVWYVHRTPEKELTDEEWLQTQSVLEDPDYSFQDLVGLVICSYFGKLTFYAFVFDKYQSARGQFPVPTELLLAADSLQAATGAGQPRAAGAGPVSPAWYTYPEVAQRLNREHDRLVAKYHVEADVEPDGQMVFQLMPRTGYGKLTFYLACQAGFPDEGPSAFLMVAGTRQPLFSPALNVWSSQHSLAEVADDMIEWLAWSLEEYVKTADEALQRGDYQEAADWLSVVLSINPRMPRAARLLARAQAALR
jgi:hypothetical protein